MPYSNQNHHKQGIYPVLPPHLRLFPAKPPALPLVCTPNVRHSDPFPVGIQARRGPAWDLFGSRASREGRREERKALPSSCPCTETATLLGYFKPSVYPEGPRRQISTAVTCDWETLRAPPLWSCSQSAQKAAHCASFSESWVRVASEPHYLADGERWSCLGNLGPRMNKKTMERTLGCHLLVLRSWANHSMSLTFSCPI